MSPPQIPVPVPAEKHHLSSQGCPKSPKLLDLVKPVWVCIREMGDLHAHGPCGLGGRDMPSRALTPSPSPRPGRLAVRYRMYRQIQLPRYRRAGPALQQRRCTYHCCRHQGKAIFSPQSPQGFLLPQGAGSIPASHDVAFAVPVGSPRSYWKSRRASRAGIEATRLVN